ncbi:TrmH family RNA methyltransferase [Hoyosella subflava]|uniref:TrmH family RNA methyltransferase n=1 Tax=Hoyosella subflava TaxID=639313 RepID=UPI00059B58D3|nr:RNA methyltransferase [Hoyosella subflava]
MDTISDRNPRVVSALKLVKAGERRKTAKFLAEGSNAVGGALENGLAIELFSSAEGLVKHAKVISDARRAAVPVWQVSDRVAQALSETVTPQGIVAVCHQPVHSLASLLDALPAEAFVAVLIDVNDPGNAGAIIRVADAAGAHGVILVGDAVDPCNGKAIRASAGSFFHLPVVRERDTSAVLRQLRDHGCMLLATTAEGEESLTRLAQRETSPVQAGRVAWIFGNEAHGLSATALAQADVKVRIPIFGQAESLNLATAAALCLYESARMFELRANGQPGHRLP